MDEIESWVKEYINTGFPVEVVSYHNTYVKVKPLINKNYEDDNRLSYEPINAKVIYPRFEGGNCGVKGVISAGTKGYVHIAQSATDGSGDFRLFDLNDAYFYPCDPSLKTPDDVGNDDFVMWRGSSSIRIDFAGNIIFKAGETSVTIGVDGTIKNNAPTGITNTTAKNKTTGEVVSGSKLTVEGGGINSTGGFSNTGGSMTNNGKKISEDDHKHLYTDDGVQKTTDIAKY